MGLNPTILRQGLAFALTLSPLRPSPVARRLYRASGLVLGRKAGLRVAAKEGSVSVTKRKFPNAKGRRPSRKADVLKHVALPMDRPALGTTITLRA